MTEYTEREISLRKFTTIQKSLTGLYNACTMSQEPRNGAILVRYASIEISQFPEYYDRFMSLLNKDEREMVLCFEPLLKEVFKNRKGLKEFRNNWVGHIQDDNKFEEDMTDFINRVNLPQKLEEYYCMIFAIDTFVNALRKKFTQDFKSLYKKFDKSKDKNRPPQPSSIDSAYREFLVKMEECKKNLSKKYGSPTKPDDDLIDELLELMKLEFHFYIRPLF